jgi:cell division septation protein DedD
MQLLSLTLLTVVVVFVQSTPKVTASATTGGQGLYYISNGQSLTEVRSEPEHVQAERWAAFYFRKGASSSVLSQRWGLEIQSSPAEVMKKVAESQKFERTYEKWCGCEWGSNTFFNVIAPVAMTKSSSALSAGKADVIIKAQGIGNRIGHIVETVDGAEYMENIHQAMDQYGVINNLIYLLSDNAVANIEKRLNQLVSEVSNIERASRAVADAGSGEDRNAREIGVAFTTATEANPSSRPIASTPSLPPPSPKITASLQPPSSTKAKEDDERKVYTIQVGVFASESNAQALMSQLKKKGYDAVFIHAVAGGRGPYHVRVGRLPDAQAAKDLRKKLEGDGFDTFVTTQERQK